MNEKVLLWWTTKGCQLFNSKIINLIGKRLGKVPMLNLFSEEELDGVTNEDLISIVKTLQNDGLYLNIITYEDGTKILRCYID